MENMIKPSKSWKNKNEHYLLALESEWYRTLASIQNELCFATYDFYRAKHMKTLFFASNNKLYFKSNGTW